MAAEPALHLPYMAMRKTSVYLPEATKAALHGLSERWERSEAELVRLAIDRLVRSAETTSAPPAPMAPARRGGPRLVGVGVGPSAPDLVTRRAYEVLEQADRVFAASTALDAIGRAEAIVRAVSPAVMVDRLPFAIAGDADARRKCLDAAAEAIVARLDHGELVAFVTLGDPNVYSTFPALARRVKALRPDVPIEVVPGVMAFQELAATTGTVLVEDDEHLELVNMGDDTSALDAALDKRDCTVVIYKGGRHLPKVAGHLAEWHRLDGAVIGEMLGLPGARSGPVSEVADRPASYLATMVIPAAGRHGRLAGR